MLHNFFRKSMALFVALLMIFNASAFASVDVGVSPKLLWSADIGASAWNDAGVPETSVIFDADAFEAGSEEVRYLKVVNEGDLAFSYVLDATYGGEDASLAEVIDVYVGEDVASAVTSADMTRVGTLAEIFSDGKISGGSIAPVGESAKDGFFLGERIVAVALKMQETAGAEYMNKTLDGFDIILSTAECEYDYAKGEFSVKFPNASNYLYRVGNANAIALSSLFDATNVIGDVKVDVESIDPDYPVAYTYSANSSNWKNGTIDFDGCGLVEVTITDSGKHTTPVSLKLEVIDAVNATGSTKADSNNVVLLNNVSGGFTVSNGYTVYGNGFTVSCGGNGAYREKTGMAIGYITLEGGNLEGVQVKCDVFPVSPIYQNQLADYDVSGDVKRYRYQLSAITVSGNSTISNCYVYGARNNIYISGGNVVIEDTVTESGSLSNIQVKANDECTVTLDDVTTVQYPTTSKYDESKNVLGFGVLMGTNETTSNAAIVLKGDLKQYNWVHSGMNVSDSNASTIINSALGVSEYQYSVGGKKVANLGFVYLNDKGGKITDERSNKAELPYSFNDIMISGYTGGVYSVKAGSSLITEASRYDASTDGVIPFVYASNSFYKPQFKFDSTLGGQYVANTEGCDVYCYVEDGKIRAMVPSGDSMNLDLIKAVDIQKYSGQELNIQVSCKDKDGNSVDVSDGKLLISQIMDYTVTYTVTDSVFYDKDGQRIEKTENWTWDVPVNVSLKDNSIPNARFEFVKENQKIYRSGNSNIVQFIPFLAGLKIYDYDGKNEYLRFDGDNDYAKVAKATINNIDTSGETQGGHIVTVELVDGGKLVIDMEVRANSGSSTHSGSIKERNNVIYVVNNGTTSGKGQTWRIYSYKFIGNNGVEINSGEIIFGTAGVDCDTATKPSSNLSISVSATVNYDANGGNCVQALAYKTNKYTTLTLPKTTRSGYTFAGWHTKASGGELVGFAGDSYSPSSNITLYAQWGIPGNVTYNANGGSCDVESAVYDIDALVLPTPSNEGYWFVGWYTAPEGGEKAGNAGDSYRPAGDTTLYARWSKIYKVSYNANGGSVSPANASYSGTPLTLPLPENAGQAFDGWYTSAEGGEKVGNQGTSYIPTSDITLYAHWKAAVTVTYNANGGSCSTASATYTGLALTLPAPSRAGYVFTGWYTSATGGSKIGDANASYIPSENITLYAQWRGCVVTYNANSGSCSTASQTYEGTPLILPTPTRSSYNFEGWYTAASGGNKIGDAGASYTPSSDITLHAQWKYDSCITPDTLITLADGSQKRVDALTYQDQLLVRDFFEGKYTSAPAAIIFNHGYAERKVIKLIFSDGTEVKMINLHQFFDATENKFINITADTVANYVGHEFAKYTDDSYEFVALTDYEITDENEEAYGVISAMHYNVIVNGMISTDFEYEDYNMFNYFDITSELKYDREKMQDDIEKYGLYTYDDFADYLTYEEFVGFNAQYLKIPVGKGLYTFDDILYRINYWGLGFSDNDNSNVIKPYCIEEAVALMSLEENGNEVVVISSGNRIASATYGIEVSVNGNEVAGNAFVCDSDECVFTINATGNASSRYAVITIGDKTYYTKALEADSNVTFAVKNAKGQAVSFAPAYGIHENEVTAEINYYEVAVSAENMTASENGYVCDADEASLTFKASGIAETGYAAITVDGDVYYVTIASGEEVKVAVKNAKAKEVTYTLHAGSHENETTSVIDLGTFTYTVDGTKVTFSNTTKYAVPGYDVYVAVYSGDKLLDVQFESIAELDAKTDKTFDPEINVPDGAEVKVLVWKYQTLVPYFN